MASATQRFRGSGFRDLGFGGLEFGVYPKVKACASRSPHFKNEEITLALDLVPCPNPRESGVSAQDKIN